MGVSTENDAKHKENVLVKVSIVFGVKYPIYAT